MAVTNRLVRGFANFQGLDLRSSDLQRGSEFGTEIKNIDFRKTGAMTKRKGFQGSLRERGGYGTATYADLNTTTGAITERLVSIDSTMHVEVKETLTITYSGSNDARCDVYYSSSDDDIFFDLYDDNALVLHQSLSSVVEKASFVSIDTLATAISGITDFTASASGNAAITPAGFLDRFRNKNITSAGLVLPYSALVETTLPTGAPTPFSGAQAAINNVDFENATFANINGVIYVATGYDSLYKFDGQRLYKAGLPKPETTPTTALVAGSVTDTRKYQYTYEYTDAKGNIIESIASDESIQISPAGQDVQVTVSNILNTTGFDTDSSDLKINLYSTTAGGETFYRIKSVVNDGTTATQVIVDDVTNPLAFPEFIEPLKEPGLPPIGKYLAVHQGLLFIGGQNGNVNSVSYSDIDSPEYFPANTNAFTVDTRVGDKVTGIAPLGNSFFVFKDDTVHQITGDINEDQFRVDLYGNGLVGCVANATIQEVNGSLLFLSKKGVYAVSQAANQLEEVSDLIEPRFTDFNNPFTFKKAVAQHWIREDKYVLFMPEVVNDYSSTGSTTFVYDYYRQAWLEWTQLNALGGMTLVNDNLLFTERRNSILNAQTDRYTYKFMFSGDTEDYADHDISIPFIYKSNWEALNEPSLFKKFLRCKIHSLDASLDDFESDDFSLELETEIDYSPVQSSFKTLNFGVPNAAWGTGEWGIFPWGATRLTSQLTKLKAVKAKSLRLILENNTIHENVLVSGYEFEIAAPYKNFIKE